MSQRNVRVDIPIGSPDNMNKLAGRIISRHIALGPSSPLDDPIVDIASLPAIKTEQEDRREEAFEGHADGEALNQQASTALGVSAGQTGDTEGTVYFHVISVRSRLLQVHDTEEEQLSKYGFRVTINKVHGRKVVSAEIPINRADDMIKLVTRILKRHNDLGPGSPLNTPEVDMVDLENKHTLHIEKRNLAIEMHDNAEGATQWADTALGVSKHQNIETAGTMYHIITAVRNKLLGVHRNEEEQLSTYGFNVVISTTPFPGEEEPTVIEGSIVSGETMGIFDELADGTSLTIENTGPVPLTFCRMEDGVSACDPIAHITLTPGEDTAVVGTELGATGIWLNVTNFDSGITGTFTVTIG